MGDGGRRCPRDDLQLDHEVTSISVRTSTVTASSPAEPPCSPVSPTGCRRSSPPSPPRPSRSRSSRPPSASTLSGLAAPSSRRSPPSSRCGSPSRSTTSLVPLLFIESVFKPKNQKNNLFLKSLTPKKKKKKKKKK